jgi:hypothetical protein
MRKEIKIKSNGLRNELKEIRKSIDNLTNAILMAQTNKRNEEDNYSSSPPDDGMRWTKTDSYIGLSGDDEGSVQREPTRNKTSPDLVA